MMEWWNDGQPFWFQNILTCQLLMNATLQDSVLQSTGHKMNWSTVAPKKSRKIMHVMCLSETCTSDGSSTHAVTLAAIRELAGRASNHQKTKHLFQRWRAPSCWSSRRWWEKKSKTFQLLSSSQRKDMQVLQWNFSKNSTCPWSLLRWSHCRRWQFQSAIQSTLVGDNQQFLFWQCLHAFKCLKNSIVFNSPEGEWNDKLKLQRTLFDPGSAFGTMIQAFSSPFKSFHPKSTYSKLDTLKFVP